MDKQVLRDVIIDQQQLAEPEKIVPRTIYDDIEHLKKSKQILIISGIRRCGKSVLMNLIRHHSKEQDYFINFDDDRLVNFKLEDFQVLYELFIEMFGDQKTFYFDEIQIIEGWERFVRRLHQQGNKIYITGSNASMLSEELGTRLTGRHIKINLYPYSFKEYLEYKNFTKFKLNSLTTIQKGKIKSAFNEFLECGGLPEYLESLQTEYLHSLYQNILYRDIIVRRKIKNHQAIKELVYYLASNLGKVCSFNALKNMLGLSSATTVSDYCGYLEDSFICYFVNRFDYSLKKQIQFPKKVYFIDQALAVAVGFRNSKDHGRVLENIVFLELKRRGHEIYFHQDKKECDFLLRKGSKVFQCIQVSVRLDDPDTREREYEGLIDAMSQHNLKSGLIITADTFAEEKETVDKVTYNIKIVPIWHWLLDNS